MHFNTQLVYLIGTESVTGAVIALSLILILELIHKFCTGFSHRQGIGWLGILAFLFPIWYVGRWIVEVGLPGYWYGATSDVISIYYGSTTGRVASVIVAVWGVGVLAGMVILTVKQIRLHRMIQKSVRVTDPTILYKLEELQESLGICRNITVLYHPTLSSPGCAGIWKPYIVMNQDSIKRENIHSVLCHELIHIKKNDILFRHVLDIISVIHWFNPFIYLFRIIMTKQIEYGCDAYVILHTGWSICPGDYMAAISRVIKKRDKGGGYVLPFGGKHEDTNNRIRYLKKITSPRLIRSIVVMMLALVIFTGASFSAYAANKTLTQSYASWVKANAGEAICEGTGEPMKEIEAEYRTTEEISAKERDITVQKNAAGISWKLDGGETAVSKAFEGSAGDCFAAFIMGETDGSYEIGLMQPDGEIIWIYVEGNGTYEFELEQNGAYHLVARNHTEKENQLDVVLWSKQYSERFGYIHIK